MTTLGLRPYFVKATGGRYTVIRRDGAQAIRTSKAGIEALQLLRAGRTVEQARRILGHRYGHPVDEINLEPLIHTLFSAGFVRTLDGRRLDAHEARGPLGVRLWLTLFVRSPLLEMALGHLPPRVALRLAYRWLARAPNPGLEGRIAANLRRAPCFAGSDGAIARVAAGNREALRKHFCDRLVLGSAPPHRVRRWLGRDVRVSGLEHLAQARSGGAGVILCSLHLGSYGLIPFVLGARGVPVTVHGGFGKTARAEVEGWLAERRRCGDAYPVQVAGGAMGLRTLARRLEGGETVLLYCDRAPPGTADPPGPRGWSKVPFLGTQIWSPQGLGWLHRRTGAAVLPVGLWWEGRAGHHLRVGQPIPIPGADQPGPTDAVMAAAYGALEEYVRHDPAQWLKWAEFDAMIAG